MSHQHRVHGDNTTLINMDALIIKLKKMLLSRNVVLQDKCIRFMIHSLKDSKQFIFISTTYLNADMIHFLCEPLLSINTSLLQNLCLCIWMLSKNYLFYERNDVLYTCNSLMRTLVFLIRSNEPSVSDLIHLLTIIIKKGGTNLQEICNMPQVLTVIKMIFSNSGNLPDRSVFNAVSILTYFLSCPSIELSNKLYNTTMAVSKTICKNVSETSAIDPSLVDIASDLSRSILRLHSTITNRVLINKNLKKHSVIAKLLKNIAWYMIKHICLPFILKNMNLSMHYKSYRKGIKSLISPFRETLTTDTRQNIANHYAASRIIRVLYAFIEYNKIGILVEELLFEVLFHLSCVYLEIECYWPGGSNMFRNQMVWGFKDLPKTPKDICFALMNNKNTADLRHTINIFIYFYLLTCSNLEDESTYLEPLCVYLCSIEDDIPVSVVKAILFNISISFVSHNAVNAVSGLVSATKKLVTLINSQVIDLVFTHHPALLYFLFSTNIVTNKIQIKLIELWIQHLDDTSSVELEKFCLNHKKAKLCLINVLSNDKNIDRIKLQKGFNIVKKIINFEIDSKDYKTLLTIWDILPIYLGSFCCSQNPKIIGATNLMCLLNLTEAYPLQESNVRINEHRSIVYTMSSIVKTYQSTFTEQYALLSSLLQHFLTLIQLSHSDGDVLNTIKKNTDFLSVLQNLCLSEDNEICFLTFKTMIKLCQIESEETKGKSKLLNSIILKCDCIVNAMSRQCHNCIISSTQLFQIVLQQYEVDTCNIVKFNEAPTGDFLKSVFVRLQTILSERLDWVSEHVWECMKTILSITFVKDLLPLRELQVELASDPWLNFLFTNLKFLSDQCLEFVHFWFTHFILNNENSFTLRGIKVFCPSLFDKTLVKISTLIVSQIYEKNESRIKAKIIINLVLKNHFILPKKLKCKMKNFLNYK